MCLWATLSINFLPDQEENKQDKNNLTLLEVITLQSEEGVIVIGMY